MSAHNDGGHAFPRAGYELSDGSWSAPQDGMTLRDYFAAAALQGLLASGHFTTFHGNSDDSSWMTMWDDVTGEEIHKGRVRFDFPEAAWRCADSILAARKGQP